MKKLFLLFLATAAMSLVSCGGSSSEESSSVVSSSTVSSIDNSVQMDAPSSMPAPSKPAEQVSSPSAPEVAASEPANEPATCPKCGGSGKVKCSKCHGKGTTYDSGLDGSTYGCTKCGGSGYAEGDINTVRKGSGKMKCPECHGSGKV